MKKTSMSLSFLIIISLSFFKCTNHQNSSGNIIHISGQIDIGLRSLYLLNHYGDTSQTIIVSPENSYHLVMEHADEGYYTLIHGKSKSALYLVPGDSLHIDIKESLLQFSGQGSQRNQYLTHKNARENNWLFKYQQSGGELPVHLSLRTHYDELKQKVQDLEKDSEFADRELRELDYAYAKDLYQRKDGLLKSNPALASDSSFTQDLNWLKNIRTDDPDAINNSQSYLSLIAKMLIKENAEQSVLETHYRLINHAKLRAYFSEELVVNLLTQELRWGVKNYNKANTVKALVQQESKFHTNEVYEILDNYDKYRRAVGVTASFSYKDHNGEKVSLEDFRGKYVYIYFWASWCRPCKKEFPYLEDLQERFKNKNIEFVGISIDELKTIEAWKKLIDKSALLSNNVQLSAPTQGYPEKDEITDEFAKLVHLNGYYIGIPHYMLIDPEGKIVDAFFYRPSNEKGNEYIAELLLN